MTTIIPGGGDLGTAVPGITLRGITTLGIMTVGDIGMEILTGTAPGTTRPSTIPGTMTPGIGTGSIPAITLVTTILTTGAAQPVFTVATP